MSNASFFDMARNRFRTELAEIDRNWGWYFALGVLLIVLGGIAGGMTVATTLFSVIALGWVLVVAGAGLIVMSFLTGKWSGFLLTLAAGALSITAGLTMLSSPLSGAVAVTVMVGAVLASSGIYRAVSSIVMQFSYWGVALLSGIVSFSLGAMLLTNWRTTSLWFLGLYVGVDLIIHGFAWVMFSLRVHSLARELGVREVQRPAA
jgi:aquaporin Z